MLALQDLALLVSVALAVVVVTPPLGRHMYRVMEGERTFLSPVLRPVERATYRICGIDETVEQGWKAYTVSLLAFSLLGLLAMYALLRLQEALPFNPAAVPPMAPDLALNTAASFETNTNWQNYAGEASASYLSQFLGLAVRNFVSAAAGIAVAIALIRGLVRRRATTIGNFWIDLTRATLYVLLPISLVGALVLVSQGVPQTFDGPTTLTTVEGAQQTIATGPIASQVFIKELGSNGGGYMNANSAHPYENPTGLSNWIELFAMLAIAFGLTYTFGRYARDQRQGWTIFGAMAVVLVFMAIVSMAGETGGNPLYPATIDHQLGNMEGKEVRLGSGSAALWAAVTTGTSNGSISGWHDSFQPIAGLAPLFSMQLGEVTPGGVGAGLYGMLILGAILAVFIAGLMVGRTPEYLGKKVEAFEMKMAMLVIILLGASLLGFTALATITSEGQAGPLNTGPHGFSEILYAYASQTGNNGSAFAGLTGNTPFYNVTGTLAMLVGRFAMMIPALAIAGSMAAKRGVAPSLGTFPTTGVLFSVLLVGVIVVVGALTYFPALALGPIVEQLLQNAGQVSA